MAPAETPSVRFAQTVSADLNATGVAASTCAVTVSGRAMASIEARIASRSESGGGPDEFPGCCYIAHVQGDDQEWHLRLHWTGSLDLEQLYDFLHAPERKLTNVRTISNSMSATLEQVLLWARRDQLLFGGEMQAWFARNEGKVQAAFDRLQPKKVGRPRNYCVDRATPAIEAERKRAYRARAK